MIPLRNGQATNDPRLDRVRAVDLRSLNFPIRELFTAEQLVTPRSKTWWLTQRFDQGPNGSCVGFGWAAELAARPGVISGIDDTFAKEVIYWGAQRADDWPGGSYPGASPTYEGTTVLAGAKEAQALGFIGEYRWALSLDDLVAAVGYHGPAVIGIDWYEQMMTPDAQGGVHPFGQIVGGHCVCVIGQRIVRTTTGIDPLRSYFILQNSWGRAWGIEGRCHVSVTEMAVLWPGAEFCIPVTRVTGAVAPR